MGKENQREGFIVKEPQCLYGPPQMLGIKEPEKKEKERNDQMKCVNCGAEIEKDSTFCTNCGAQLKPGEPVVVEEKPEETTPATQPPTIVPAQPQKSSNAALIIVLVVIGVLFFVVIGGIVVTTKVIIPAINNIDVDKEFEEEVIKTVTTPNGKESVIKTDKYNVVTVDTQYLYEEASAMEEDAKVISATEIEELEATNAQKEALRKVRTVISYGAYSEKGLRERLKDDFAKKDIDYAIEHCQVDWDEQALIEAYITMSIGGSSKKEAIDFLVYEGFDEKMATAAVEKGDFDYYEQALYEACFYRYAMSKYSEYDKEKVKDRLEEQGFTPEEIDYAVTEIYDKLDYKK